VVFLRSLVAALGDLGEVAEAVRVAPTARGSL